MTHRATSQNKHHKSRKQTTLKSTCFAQFNTQANTCVQVKQCKQHASSNIPAHCKHRDCESSQHNKQHANKTASMRKRNEMEWNICAVFVTVPRLRLRSWHVTCLVLAAMSLPLELLLELEGNRIYNTPGVFYLAAVTITHHKWWKHGDVMQNKTHATRKQTHVKWSEIKMQAGNCTGCETCHLWFEKWQNKTKLK